MLTVLDAFSAVFGPVSPVSFLRVGNPGVGCDWFGCLRVMNPSFLATTLKATKTNHSPPQGTQRIRHWGEQAQ
jgi:hypothetical protein